jgi:antagonist of KipI
MRTLLVNKPGVLTTVQDLGRPGFGVMGISPSGAADSVSLRIGNRLVGNPENAAALEMTLFGGEFQFSAGTVVAATGSNFGPSLGSHGIPLYHSVSVPAGQKIEFGLTHLGARCYLCVQGGIDVKEFLGSRSTHLLSGLGGHEGRALRKGDVLNIGKPLENFRHRRLSGQGHTNLVPRKIFRVTEGPQWAVFPEAAKKLFFEQPYQVTEEANRMGIRLLGQPLDSNSQGEMITEGVSLGAIQITPSGQPVILFVEQQTTGGYPKLANIIAADLARLGQLRPRDKIYFELVTLDSARASLLRLEQYLTSSDLIQE